MAPELIVTVLGLLGLPGFGPMPAQDPPPAKAAAPATPAGDEPPAKAVGQLVEPLRRHPPRPTTGEDRIGLYMIDVTNAEVTLIADEPDPGLTQCGSPTWSTDGRRILYDATPGAQFNRTHLKAIEVLGGHPVVTELGPGNCPTVSPTGDRIAFLLNAGAVSNAESGVWMMNADGSERRLLGSYGVPKWSPYGRQLMIISFSTPREVTVMDARPEKSGPLRIPGHQVYSVPNWAGDGTIVAVIGPDGAAVGDALALIDVSDPGRAKIQEVLWKRGDEVDVKLYYPVYSPITRRCVFVREDAKGMALYAFQRGRPDAPKRLEPEGYDTRITGLAYSPDGRYVLFSSTRTERREAGPVHRNGAAAPADDPSREPRKTP